MQGDEKVESAIANDTRESAALATMIELERDLTFAREEAGREASAAGLSNDSSRFLLGLSIGLDRALKILQTKMAVLRADAPTRTEERE
jgi:hypothetical protein